MSQSLPACMIEKSSLGWTLKLFIISANILSLSRKEKAEHDKWEKWNCVCRPKMLTLLG